MNGPSYSILQGDVLERLDGIERGSIHCVVTSPPFWGLRRYDVCPCAVGEVRDPACEWCSGTGRVSGYHPSVWGGDLNCHHEWKATGSPDRNGWWFCVCGAGRGHLGLEVTPDEFIDHLKLVMDGLWRVLRDDGVAFIELGDTYTSGGVGVREKSLALIPERFALACQRARWVVRSKPIWQRPNPMPEGASDRPTVDYSQIYMLSKSPQYFSDMEGVRMRGHNLRTVWTIPPSADLQFRHYATYPVELARMMVRIGTSEMGCCQACGAQIRRVVRASGGGIGRTIDDHSAPDPIARGRSGVMGAGVTPGWSTSSYVRSTVGWERTCDCPPDTPTRPSTVLDPFAGSGTTLAAAKMLGRDSIGIELSPYFTSVARGRLDSVKVETPYQRGQARLNVL